MIDINYKNRNERNICLINLIKKISPNFKNLCNIGGGGKRYLSNIEKNKNIYEIDFVGDNDLNINLDNIEKLPLPDNSFTIVSAMDVLEHLENFHLILDEMFRISNQFVIISLPNSNLNFWNILFNKKNKDLLEKGLYTKYYGLPLKKPQDRHRWFLSIGDITRFFKNYSERKKTKLKFIFPSRKHLFHIFLKFLLSKRLYEELFVPWVWIILEKK